MKKVSGFIVLLVLCTVYSSAIAAASNPDFDEKELRDYLDEFFGADDYTEYGFTTEDRNQLSFGEPVAIYNLNPSFAFGESDTLLQEDIEEWISIIYENEIPINGLKLREYPDGTLNVSGFGYPITLAADVAELNESEVLMYEFPTGYYYAFNPESNSLRLLEEEVRAAQPDDELVEGISVEEFQLILKESNGLGGSEPAQHQSQSIVLYSSVGIGVAVLFSLILWRKRSAY
ncbi:hypothetical protein [Alkalicoccobacillus murimartini]|uniref:Uncharacterized protein n=1 Tax=Alkalicoccobacillus murimartini TaxID=171685 RepID=A0ABT9YMI6_9BACI|nr:hypothetical protein [Alkalicoccobacillus murimartini]MDQ0209072.1 hypothetical protein [Alkalicoccobacillus murimartini]